MRPSATTAVLLSVAAVALTGCTSNPTPGATGGGRLAVTASDSACTLSASEVAAGAVTFTVTNTGTKENEFYVYAADGQKVLGEVEDIGPGVARDLTVTLPAGTYVTACKPGMVGDGIRGSLTVTDAGTATAGS